MNFATVNTRVCWDSRCLYLFQHIQGFSLTGVGREFILPFIYVYHREFTCLSTYPYIYL